MVLSHEHYNCIPPVAPKMPIPAQANNTPVGSQLAYLMDGAEYVPPTLKCTMEERICQLEMREEANVVWRGKVMSLLDTLLCCAM